MNNTISIQINIPVQENWYTMAETAKLINGNMGRTKLFRFLREEYLLMEDNEPYQKHIDSGFFKYVIKDVINSNGEVLFQQMVTLVSTKGMDYIKKLINKKEGSYGSK